MPCTLAKELRIISLTSVLAKLQKSFSVKWMGEEIDGKISDFQYGKLPGSSALYAHANVAHKWYKTTNESHRLVRIISLDFRKVFDLIDHKRVLENIREIGARHVLVNWRVSYLSKRSHFAKHGNEMLKLKRLKVGAPQGSKLGTIAFFVQINKLLLALKKRMESVLLRTNENHDIIDEDTALFMEGTTVFEVIDTQQHVSGVQIGNTQSKINRIMQLTKNQRMELSLKKCKDTVIDFRRNTKLLYHQHKSGIMFLKSELL